MQISSSKIKTEWENLEDIKPDKPILIQNNPSTLKDLEENSPQTTRKTEKEDSLILNTFVQFQTQHILGLETIFGTSFSWQKRFFDNLGIDHNVISEFGKLCNAVVQESGITLNAFVKFSQIQSGISLDTMKMYNNFLNQGLDWYSKAFSYFITKK